MRTANSRCLAIILALAIALLPAIGSAESYRTLEFGSRGTDVLRLQKALLTLGYDPNGTDGKFGTGTQSAVIIYQTENGLTADGKAGKLTQTMIYAALAGSGSSSTGDSSGSSGSDTSGATNPNTLKYGDSGERVRELQTALNKLGFTTNGIDGRFGAGTKRAVISFQKANGLTADGLAGAKTVELALNLAKNAGGASSSDDEKPANTSNEGSNGKYTRTLRKGMMGDDVRTMQQKLRELGYYFSTVDGVFGAGSAAAVKAFQKNNGLAADGVAGSGTFKKLFGSSPVAAGGSENTGSENGGSSGGTSTSEEPPSSNGYTTLSYGSKGTAVKELQKALKALGYNVSTDGDYGALTKSAVAAFQSRNGLTSDGVAGADTQKKLFSGKAVAADPNADADMRISDDTGKSDGPNVGSVKLLHWYNEVKPSLKAGNKLTVFDPATNLEWKLRVYSPGHHADSEPLTLTDTKIMYKAFGFKNTWTPKAVYVKLPSGAWTVASMHNVPHLTGSISDNGFDGHLCVHFLRDMEECQKNDPDYGVTNQKLIRKKWKQITGIDVE